MPDSLSRSQREDGITPADSRESQNRFCKETTRRRPKTCKYHYFAGDNQSHRSTACGFFTDDKLRALGQGLRSACCSPHCKPHIMAANGSPINANSSDASLRKPLDIHDFHHIGATTARPFS